MVWKIHILTLLFLSPISLHNLLMQRIWIYGRYDEKVGQITTEIPCFAFFCDCATRSQLSFLNSLITRAPSSGNWCRYKRRLLLNWKYNFQIRLDHMRISGIEFAWFSGSQRERILCNASCIKRYLRNGLIHKVGTPPCMYSNSFQRC